MGNSSSYTGIKRKPNIHIATFEEGNQSIPNFENRWQAFLKSLDVSEEKIRIIESLDETKKSKLILEYEKKLPKDGVNYYIKILSHFSKSNVSILKKKEETQNLISVISSLEISLRTNSVDWILEFINEDGLESLIDVMSNVLFLLSNSIDLNYKKFNLYQRRNLESPFTPAKERKNSSLSIKSSTNDLPNSAKFLQPTIESEKSNYDTNPRPYQHRNITVLSPNTTEKLKEILHQSLKCLKSLLNNQTGCRKAFNYPNVCDIITFCLLHPSYLTKQLSLEMLSALCLIEGGHSKVLLSFDCLQREIGEASRFEWLMNDFRRHENYSNPDEYNIDYAVSCMQFINIVVHSCDNINLRVYLQYCFHLLGLDKFILNIKDNCGNRLLEQIDAYEHNRVDCNLLLDDAEAKENYQHQLEEFRNKIKENENREYENVIESLRDQIKILESDLSKKDEEIELLQITINNQNTSSRENTNSLNQYLTKYLAENNEKMAITERLIPEGCDDSNSMSGISTPENQVNQSKIPKPKRSLKSQDSPKNFKQYENQNYLKYIKDAEKLINKLNSISINKTKFCLVPVKPLGWNLAAFRKSNEDSAFSSVVFERNLRNLSLEKISMKLNSNTIKDPWKQSIVNQEKSHSKLLIEPIEEIYRHLINLSLDPINNEYLDSIVEYRDYSTKSSSVVTKEMIRIIDTLEDKLNESSHLPNIPCPIIKTYINGIKALTTFNLECKKIIEQLSIILSACKSIMTSRKLPIILRFINLFVLKLTGSTEQILGPDQHFPIHLIDTLINWRLYDVEYSGSRNSSMSKSVSFIQMFWHFLKNSHPNLVDWTNELTNIEKASACNLTGIPETLEKLEGYLKSLKLIRDDSLECQEIEETFTDLKHSFELLTKLGYCTMAWLNDEIVNLDAIPIHLSPLAKFVSAYRQQTFSSSTSGRRGLGLTKSNTDTERMNGKKDNAQTDGVRKVSTENDISNDELHERGNSATFIRKTNGKAILAPVKRRSQTRQLNTDGLLENILEGIYSKPLRASIHNLD